MTSYRILSNQMYSIVYRLELDRYIKKITWLWMLYILVGRKEIVRIEICVQYLLAKAIFFWTEKDEFY